MQVKSYLESTVIVSKCLVEGSEFVAKVCFDGWSSGALKGMNIERDSVC